MLLHPEDIKAIKEIVREVVKEEMKADNTNADAKKEVSKKEKK